MKTICLIFVLAMAGTAYGFNLDWQYTPNTEEGFRIYRKMPGEQGFSLLTQLDKTQRSYVDPDRTAGICYRLIAYNFAGESAPGEACANAPAGITSMTLK